jgi:hypothetical protein
MPAGLVPRSSWKTSRWTTDLPVRKTDPILVHTGIWISDGGRARRLLTEEFAKGPGVLNASLSLLLSEAVANSADCASSQRSTKHVAR